MTDSFNQPQPVSTSFNTAFRPSAYIETGGGAGMSTDSNIQTVLKVASPVDYWYDIYMPVRRADEGMW